MATPEDVSIPPPVDPLVAPVALKPPPVRETQPAESVEAQAQTPPLLAVKVWQLLALVLAVLAFVVHYAL